MAAVMTSTVMAATTTVSTTVNGVAAVAAAVAASTIATITIAVAAAIATTFDDVELSIKNDGLMAVQLNHPAFFAGLVNRHNHWMNCVFFIAVQICDKGTKKSRSPKATA